jgi:hypothetical protein
MDEDAIARAGLRSPPQIVYIYLLKRVGHHSSSSVKPITVIYKTRFLSAFRYVESVVQNIWTALVVSSKATRNKSLQDLVSPVAFKSRSQWPRGQRRRSAADLLLRSWVWIPPGVWMPVCCECSVLPGSLCDEMITCPEECYRLFCVVVCDQETSWMRKPWPALGRSTTWKK